ncbi:adventurous gliding motility lipoprotein CglB [Archangium gephyra]|uniref:adventurous gliding motility lipoprotein CglB n=1 Tax=Archangium gephyra TaxID=48 RepID=UPI0035D4075C
MRASLILLSVFLATGCQTYDFEEVAPLAISQTTKNRRVETRKAKPNLMLLVDTSGSMTEPVNPSLAACNPGGVKCGAPSNPCDTVRCPTRWSSLQDAMQGFLTSSASIARFGLATYPHLGEVVRNDCGGTAGLTVALPSTESDDAATLETNAQSVNAQLQAIRNHSADPKVKTPDGGTPTSVSLQFLGAYEPLRSELRSNFVVLLTDGLPNCNPDNSTPYPSPNCRCTLSNPEFCMSAPYSTLGCLDQDGSVTAVKALKDKGIQTIVIGFGAETATGTGTDVLNAMAREGGFSRSCAQDADCGAGDTCDELAGQCNRLFYQAANKEQLAEALRRISDEVTGEDACVLRFAASERPSAEELVVVYLDEERVSPGEDTWRLQDEGLVFLGSTCERLQRTTTADPVDIEVRAIQRQ